MNPIEELVTAFLEQRELRHDYAPEDFAREHSAAGDRLLPALRAALQTQDLLEQVALTRPGTIGAYSIVREIGRGGMGVVYEARRGEERLAIKVLLHAGVRGPRSLERFRREAAALRRVEHPGVVRVRDEGTLDGAPWLAMELVEGRPLSERADGCTPLEACRIVRELALALEAVHAAGVLHRDLKPANVILRPDGKPVVCDFGLVWADDGESLTASEELLGTPRYMAPEQVLGRACDERTDVHALGLLLYELACGSPARQAESRARILEQVARSDFVRPRRLAPALPRALERVVLQALAHEPARRYGSARELAEDLERLLAGRPVRARPPSALARLLVRSGWTSRAWTAAASIGLILGALALWLLRGSAPSQGPQLALALERAAWAWIDGRDSSARRQGRAALGMAPGDAAVARFVQQIETSSYSEADGAFDSLGAASATAAHLASARTDRIAGLRPAALERLERALALQPDSAALHAERAWVLHELERQPEAERGFARAIELDPSNPMAHEALALWAFAQGRSAQGFEAARQASALVAAEGEPPTHLARLLDRAPRPAELVGVLERHLERHPDDAEASLALAMAYDREHELEQAARQYGALIERRPEHAYARTYLAYLQLGALGDRCEECIQAFLSAPAVLDREAGTRNLVRALGADAGRDEALLRTIQSIALDKGLKEPLADELRRLLATGERSARTARLESALRRVE